MWLTRGQNLGWSRDPARDVQDLADLAALGYAAEPAASEEDFTEGGVMHLDCDCDWCERYADR